VLFGVGFAFSFDHPEWAKGNFLLCSVFLVKKGNLLGESHPLSQNSPQPVRYIPNPGGEIKRLGKQDCGMRKNFKSGE
jgi:hypothetical protein